MKLFLASRAIDPESLKKLEKFVLSNKKDLRKSKIVYIPTAGNGEGWESWKGSESLKYIQSINKNVKVTPLEDCCSREIISEIKEADILWMAGGYCAYLMYWIRRSELDKALPELFTKGIIYVGSSAGSMVCSKTLWAAELFEDAEHGAGLVPGLGYLGFEINPHYTDDKLEGIKKRWNHGALYLLKDGEAITYEDGKVNYLGEKRLIQ